MPRLLHETTTHLDYLTWLRTCLLLPILGRLARPLSPSTLRAEAFR
jgi:hypothetical protein